MLLSLTHAGLQGRSLLVTSLAHSFERKLENFVSFTYPLVLLRLVGRLHPSGSCPFSLGPIISRHSGLSPVQSQKLSPAKPGRTKSSRGPMNGT